MTGVPREFAPHQHMGGFGTLPPPRERRRAARSGGNGKRPVMGMGALQPINERRQDAATSTTDLAGQLGAATGQGLSEEEQGGRDGGDTPKTGKAQLNALAIFKVFSAALRR
jgi:hypothetical protein